MHVKHTRSWMWALKRAVYNYSLYKTRVISLSIITYM